tara:strand:+ start:5923 stop:6579 length:657 start_codon:yes stop_codon:yes gene_type:complete
MDNISGSSLVIVGTVVTIVSSYFVGVKSQPYRPSIQPRNGAFSIWGLIFVSLIASGIALLNSNQPLLPSVFCMLSLLSCTLWLFVANTKFAVYALTSACLFASCASLLYKYTNTVQDAIILIGPNILFSWLTLASALGFVIHLKEFWNIPEQDWMPIPFLVFNVAIAIANVVRGSYPSALAITFPLVWTALFSSKSWIFLSTALIEIGFVTGFLLKSC